MKPMIAAALLGAIAALGASAPAAADEPTVLKLEQYRKTIAARVEIAGKERLMVFDTGGGITIVSPAPAKDIGCAPHGRITGFRLTGDRLDTERCDDVPIAWSGKALSAPLAGVFDIAPLMGPDAEAIDGLLALDLFDGQVITLDAAGLAIVVETPESLAARIAGATEVPIHLAREVGGRALAAYVTVPSSAGPLAFELDSGNGGTLLVSKPYAATFGLDADAQGPQQGTIAVAGGIAASGAVFTPDLVIDGNLGMPFLKDYVLTLDLANGRAWLKRNPTPAPEGMGTPPGNPRTPSS